MKTTLLSMGFLVALAAASAAPSVAAEFTVGVDADRNGECAGEATVGAGPASVTFNEEPASYSNALVEETLAGAGVGSVCA